MEDLIRSLNATDPLGLLCVAESGGSVSVAAQLACAHGLCPPEHGGLDLFPARLGKAAEVQAPSIASGSKAALSKRDKQKSKVAARLKAAADRVRTSSNSKRKSGRQN